jgi:hypothetical protein
MLVGPVVLAGRSAREPADLCLIVSFIQVVAEGMVGSAEATSPGSVSASMT